MKPFHYCLTRLLQIHALDIQGKTLCREANVVWGEIMDRWKGLSRSEVAAWQKVRNLFTEVFKGKGRISKTTMKPFHKSMSLLLKLHELGPDGDAGTDKGEAIRDQLDELWNQLTDEEKEAWGEVSGLLGIEAER